jgi:hypothetical protein
MNMILNELHIHDSPHTPLHEIFFARSKPGSVTNPESRASQAGVSLFTLGFSRFQVNSLKFCWTTLLSNIPFTHIVIALFFRVILVLYVLPSIGSTMPWPSIRRISLIMLSKVGDIEPFAIGVVSVLLRKLSQKYKYKYSGWPTFVFIEVP